MYRWFLFIYQASYVLGILGYIILLLVFTGISFLFPVNPDTVLEAGVTLVFYGVYYGVMGRDCAEVCVDHMAAAMTVSACNYCSPLVYTLPLPCDTPTSVYYYGTVPAQGWAEGQHVCCVWTWYSVTNGGRWRSWTDLQTNLWSFVSTTSLLVVNTQVWIHLTYPWHLILQISWILYSWLVYCW